MKKDKILWIDDEIDLLTPYILFLEEKGYELTTATNGKDALELIGKQNFEIIFLDENMPGMTGLETLAGIKELNQDIPVVMITKSEEENIMEQAIGSKISDYLTKPVNPSQILLSLKKNLHKKEIVSEKTIASYRSEFGQLSMQINAAGSYEEWVELYKKIVNWEIELAETEKGLEEILQTQKDEANREFFKFIKKNYSEWFESPETQPLLSQNIVQKKVFPLLDEKEKVFFIVIDNFRYDQWLAIRPLINEFYQIESEEIYCSILPTATQYARNAIFAGLLPVQIKNMYPQFWVDEQEEIGKNLKEKELLETQIERFRKKYRSSYHKIKDSAACEQLISKLPELDGNGLNVCVLNFIDMLSHARTDSVMMRELANDAKAYRSLSISWFRHSATYELFKSIAERGYKVVITTDHGTIQVENPIKIIGYKDTNTNLRYKVGKNLTYNPKEVYEAKHPEKIGLPISSVSSAYVFAGRDNFFAYPNNFNHYAGYYKKTFQHGGISLEEMLIPLAILTPKK